MNHPGRNCCSVVALLTEYDRSIKREESGRRVMGEKEEQERERKRHEETEKGTKRHKVTRRDRKRQKRDENRTNEEECGR